MVLRRVVWTVVVMGVPWVVAMDASMAAHWVASLAAEKDMETVAVSVESKVATWVVVTAASTVGHSADCSACARGNLMAVHWVDLLVAAMVGR